jgi:hypothetical protein
VSTERSSRTSLGLARSTQLSPSLGQPIFKTLVNPRVKMRQKAEDAKSVVLA